MAKLELQQLSYEFKKKLLLNQINFTFESKTLYGVLGPNGSGKSTLLKTMSGVWTPTQGRVLWNQQDLLQCSRLEMSKMISLVPQHPTLHFDFTASEMVAMGCYVNRLSSQEEQSIVEQKLKCVDAWHLRDRLLSQLSGGERQRIYIARALATEAPILLLDEPTTYLDIRHQLDIWNLLKTIVKEDKMIIVAVHDLAAAQRFCDHVLILKQGHCVANGSPNLVINAEILEQVFDLEFTKAYEVLPHLLLGA